MRIVIMGNAGSGKSTLARRLVGESGVPILSLDGLAWTQDDAGALDRMSLLLEFDTKAFYIGAHKTINLGLLYTIKETGHLGLSIADLASANIFVFKGAYDF